VIMKAALVLAALVLPHAAFADDTFEARAQAAQRVKHIADVIWAVTAKCDAGDDTQQRQCRTIRDEGARALAGATLLGTGDETAFEVSGWNASRKSVAIKLAGCVACSGVEIDGKTWYVAGASSNPHFEGGRLRAAMLFDNAKTFPDEDTAVRFVKTVRKVAVEMLIKLPAKPRWNVAGKDGIVVEIAGYRVIDPCAGSIIIASPASGPVEANRRACVPSAPAHP
jgi:hypothetical protein